MNELTEKEIIKLIESYMNTQFKDLLSLSNFINRAKITFGPHLLKAYSSEYLFDIPFTNIYIKIANETYKNHDLIIEKCIKRREEIIKLNKNILNDKEYFIIKTIHKYIEMLLNYEVLWCFEKLPTTGLNPEKKYIYDYLLKLGEMYLSLTNEYFVKSNKNTNDKYLKLKN